MKKYFKRFAESDIGEGFAYVEVIDSWVSRQVEIYGDQYRWADKNNTEWLADQPLSELGLKPEDEILKEEFESVWMEAKKKCL
ncbi:MAG: hypothetical protein Q3M24_00505 [Candidatus Electrothrix aestuarii]|uniref:Uncharacterized protein n=1 Tax=Candidatus Electrothrix aestuarii TaxID=3062594 RepID=A0AAU8LWN4_9BACT|nr:hypothetical protein [Candidatus Electrothrix aestuarii]